MPRSAPAPRVTRRPQSLSMSWVGPAYFTLTRPSFFGSLMLVTTPLTSRVVLKPGSGWALPNASTSPRGRRGPATKLVVNPRRE